MLFGQLANRESLSDLVTCLQTQKNKWYHLGLGVSITKSNLSHANEKRNWRIYADFAYLLIARARKVCAGSADFELNIEDNVYAVDSTTIDLCLNIFWWAKFRKHKAAIKLHTQFDIKTNIPHFIHFTDGSAHDVNVMDILLYEPGSFYIFDRGYVDFERLYSIHQSQAWFVTRPKENMNYRRLYSKKAEKDKGIKVDQTIKLNNHYASKNYPGKLRLIKYCDVETGLELEFLSNNFDLEAFQIAMLYKYRWRIELFFKWIKQHLKIQSFWGTSENAVRIQVYTAIIAYTTVAIMKQTLKIGYTNYEILQILSLTLLSKTPVSELFEMNNQQYVKELNDKQLILF
jgi:transposase